MYIIYIHPACILQGAFTLSDSSLSWCWKNWNPSTVCMVQNPMVMLSRCRLDRRALDFVKEVCHVRTKNIQDQQLREAVNQVNTYKYQRFLWISPMVAPSRHIPTPPIARPNWSLARLLSPVVASLRRLVFQNMKLRSRFSDVFCVLPLPLHAAPLGHWMILGFSSQEHV